ncbi:MAG: amidase family protein, partial [Actinomycetota bacterium]
EFLRLGLSLGDGARKAALARMPGYRKELAAVLAGDAVIATPTLAAAGWLAEGPLPGSDAIAPTDDVYNVNCQNLAGAPGISVPAGTFASGVPFGLQFTGPRDGEDLLLGIAAEWERAAPWPLAAPGYVPFGEA